MTKIDEDNALENDLLKKYVPEDSNEYFEQIDDMILRSEISKKDNSQWFSGSGDIISENKPIFNALSSNKVENFTGVSNKQWMVTFADILALLITFFVLILSTKHITDRSLKIFSNSLVSIYDFKTLKKSFSDLPSVTTIPNNIDYKQYNTEYLSKLLKVRVERNEILSLVLKISYFDNGVKLAVDIDNIFEKDSVVFSDRGKIILTELIKLFDFLSAPISVNLSSSKTSSLDDYELRNIILNLSLSRGIKINDYFKKNMMHGFIDLSSYIEDGDKNKIIFVVNKDK